MMREEILERAASAGTREEGRAILRECIQAATLRSLHESGAFASICLSGEAARRFAGGSPGYAADLEFRIVDKMGRKPGAKSSYKPERWLFAARRRLGFMGLDARIAFARKASTHSGWIRVSGLLAEAGLADLASDTVGFRIVIDIAPIDASTCAVKLVDAAGECFAVRYRYP